MDGVIIVIKKYCIIAFKHIACNAPRASRSLGFNIDLKFILNLEFAFVLCIGIGFGNGFGITFCVCLGLNLGLGIDFSVSCDFRISFGFAHGVLSMG